MDIQLECSPNTFHRLQTDTEYREKLTDDLMKRNRDENSDFVPNIIVTEVPGAEEEADVEDNAAAASEIPEISEIPDISEIPEIQSGLLEENVASGLSSRDREVWVEAPTKLLLSLYEDLRPKVGKTFALKNKNKMWQYIQKKLAEAGYSFSVAQIQGKYRTLERRFKQTKLNNSKTGRERQTCPFESELEKILGKNRALQPEFLVDSDSPMTQRDDSADGSSGVESNVASTSGFVAKRPRKETVQTKLFKKLDNIEKLKTEYQEHKMDFNAKLLKILEHKNELLGKIAEKLDK